MTPSTKSAVDTRTASYCPRYVVPPSRATWSSDSTRTSRAASGPCQPGHHQLCETLDGWSSCRRSRRPPAPGCSSRSEADCRMKTEQSPGRGSARDRASRYAPRPSDRECTGQCRITRPQRGHLFKMDAVAPSPKASLQTVAGLCVVLLASPAGTSRGLRQTDSPQIPGDQLPPVSPKQRPRVPQAQRKTPKQIPTAARTGPVFGGFGPS